MPDRYRVFGFARAMRGSAWTFLFLLALLTAGLYGQQDFRGSIEGQVKDESGGAIPGATVTATLLSQDKNHTALSDDKGAYSLPYLEPGTYRLKATMPGFKTYERTDIVIQVGDKLTIDIILPVGKLSDEVIVRGDTTPLVQQVSSFDQAVDERQIEDLPMNGRNAYLLFGLAAGVLPEGDPSRLRPFDNDAASDLTVGGTGNRTSEISLDGGTNVTGGGRIVSIPSTEAVKEFKVTTSSFDASVGNTTGAIINASIKSGGKKYSGSVYEYHRNSALDANYWTANREGIPLPSAKWNQFGGTFGGPVRLPFRPPSDKPHTFFFLNYEGMRQNRVDAPFVRTVPTELERRGDFSQSMYLDTDGQFKRVIVYDPLSSRCSNCFNANGQPDPYGNPPFDPNRPGVRLPRTYTRQPFPNNVIPRDRMNPVAMSLLQFFPLPNRPGDPTTRAGNYIKNAADINNYDQLIARVDHNLSERQSLFLSLSFSGLNNTLVNWLGNVASPNQSLGDRSTRRFTLGDTYTFGSGMVMNAQYSFARYVDRYRQATIGLDLAAAGFSPEYIAKIQQEFVAAEGNTAFPDLDINNYLRLGTGGDNVKGNIANDAHEGRVNFTKILGRHGLRWGWDGRAIRRNEYNFGLPSGRLTFNKGFTKGPNPSDPETVATGDEFASFLLGYPASGYIEQKSTFAVQDLYMGAFVQDDFKVGGRLTLNVGLRWEFWLPRTERFNAMTRGFAYEVENPSAAAIRARIEDTSGPNTLGTQISRLPQEIQDIYANLPLKGGLLYAGRDGAPRGMFDSHPGLFAPRFGFAYKLSDKMVLRGGAGYYFEPLTRVGNPPQDGYNPRTGYSATTTCNPFGAQPAFLPLPNGTSRPCPTQPVDPLTIPRRGLSNPFPDDLVPFTGASRGPLTNLGQSITFVNPDRTAPSVLRTEFGIQRELPGKLGINANFLTTRWHGRPVDVELNDIPDTYLARGADFYNQTVPNPFYDPNPPRTPAGAIDSRNATLPRNSTLGNSQTIALSRLLKPYPEYDSVKTSFNKGYGWYYGFNLNVSRRFQRGFMFQTAYTLSKGMTATTYANVDDRRRDHLDRRLLDDDRPQRLVVNGIWELPLGRGKLYFNDGWASRLLGGWQVSGIGTFMKGRPINFGDTNRTYAVETGEPVQLANGPYYDSSLRRWVWFNTKAFRPRLSNELLNVPRNLPNVRSQGINTIDLRLTRNIPLTERLRMQFVAETFNLTNRVQWAPPNTDIRSKLFGTTGTQANLPRSYQFALRLQF